MIALFIEYTSVLISEIYQQLSDLVLTKEEKECFQTS